MKLTQLRNILSEIGLTSIGGEHYNATGIQIRINVKKNKLFINGIKYNFSLLNKVHVIDRLFSCSRITDLKIKRNITILKLLNDEI